MTAERNQHLCSVFLSSTPDSYKIWGDCSGLAVHYFRSPYLCRVSASFLLSEMKMIVFPPSRITGNSSAVEPDCFVWEFWPCWFEKFLRFVNVAFFINLSISIFRKIRFFYEGKKSLPAWIAIKNNSVPLQKLTLPLFLFNDPGSFHPFHWFSLDCRCRF